MGRVLSDLHESGNGPEGYRAARLAGGLDYGAQRSAGLKIFNGANVIGKNEFEQKNF